jgi:hypothetical protein
MFISMTETDFVVIKDIVLILLHSRQSKMLIWMLGLFCLAWWQRWGYFAWKFIMKSDYFIVLHVMNFRFLNWPMVAIWAFVVRVLIVFVVDLNNLPCMDVNWFLRALVINNFCVVSNDALNVSYNPFLSRFFWIKVFIKVSFALLVIPTFSWGLHLPAWRFACIFLRGITVVRFLESHVITFMLCFIINFEFLS